MKLVKVTISNYRSIKNAYNLDISNLTVLVGPNNEGKSNILKAINLGLDILSNWNKKKQVITRMYRTSNYQEERIDYNWNRDFPINLQEGKPDGRSTITLELELDRAEFSAFQAKTGINLTTNLKIKMGFGLKDVSYDILMKGKAKKSLNSKRNEISEFIQSKLVYQYISAIRPSSYAKGIIQRVLEIELFKLETNKEYQDAIKKIDELQNPVFLELSRKISESIKKFIPRVNSVSVQKSDDYGRYMRRKSDVFIDDGTNTELSLKGDGIVSLASISLVQHFNNELAKSRNLIFAIEEPESHLHPDSINALKSVLINIAEDSQVIISTHSPILVDRSRIQNNIIVNCGKALKPKSISEIRKSLGIRLSDNLVNAQLALLVEGESDKIILSEFLSNSSDLIRNSIMKGIMIIDGIGGAAKLSYYSQFYKQSLTNIHVYFDNDEEGRKSIERCIDNSVILDSEYNLISCIGMSDSEIEDMFKIDAYRNVVLNEFSVDLKTSDFKKNKKWSERVEKVFLNNGKLWNEKTESRIKTIVAKSVVEYGIDSFIEKKRSSFDALVVQIESKLAGIS